MAACNSFFHNFAFPIVGKLLITEVVLTNFGERKGTCQIQKVKISNNWEQQVEKRVHKLFSSRRLVSWSARLRHSFFSHKGGALARS